MVAQDNSRRIGDCGDEALFSGSTQIPSKSSINMVVRLSRRRKDWILLSDHVQYKPTMSLCIAVYMFVRFVCTDDLRSEVELCVRTLAACAA